MISVVLHHRFCYYSLSFSTQPSDDDLIMSVAVQRKVAKNVLFFAWPWPNFYKKLATCQKTKIFNSWSVIGCRSFLLFIIFPFFPSRFFFHHISIYNADNADTSHLQQICLSLDAVGLGMPLVCWRTLVKLLRWWTTIRFTNHNNNNNGDGHQTKSSPFLPVDSSDNVSVSLFVLFLHFSEKN